MGLDITAFSHLEFIRPLKDGDDDEWWAEGEYLPDGGFGRMGSHPEGIYRRPYDCDSFHFRAGSYSGYNRWRELLCRFAFDHEPAKVWGDGEEQNNPFAGQPFFELINFSDCEGTIGPEICAKLAADFESHLDEAEEWARCNLASGYGGDERGWFVARYKDWLAAFKLAAGRGFVKFH